MRNFQNIEIGKINVLFLLAMLNSSSGCSSLFTYTQEDAMRRFVQTKDFVVMRQENIHGYLDPHSGVNLESVTEVRPGVLEYSLLVKYPIFNSAERRCRFIFVAQKDTGTIIDWRYNGKPEYCTQSRG